MDFAIIRYDSLQITSRSPIAHAMRGLTRSASVTFCHAMAARRRQRVFKAGSARAICPAVTRVVAHVKCSLPLDYPRFGRRLYHSRIGLHREFPRKAKVDTQLGGPVS